MAQTLHAKFLPRLLGDEEMAGHILRWDGRGKSLVIFLLKCDYFAIYQT
jgi:hypothetical protein